MTEFVLKARVNQIVTKEVVDKSMPVYLTENTSIVVTSGTASAIEYVCNYESIS